ncbi:MAG: amidohydrolase family protein [Clostridia bacterium]|nr:amidohydrolase family protein [Clostridia bacterium]
MIIDSHQHVMIPASLQLEQMDQAGVQKTILFATAPHPEQAPGLDGIRREMESLHKILAGSHGVNDTCTRLSGNIHALSDRIAQYPQRFLGFGPVPLGLTVRDTSLWLEQNILKHGFKGLGEFTPGNDRQMEQLEAVFEAAGDYPRLPLWVHTFHPVTRSGLDILMALCLRHPCVPVIFGHLGGSYWMDVIAFTRQHPNAYLDLSAVFSSMAAKIAVHELPERCLFSSDAPYGSPWLSRQMVELVSECTETAALVLGGNIARLLDLDL